jgi:hypothetical protein
MMEVPAIIFPQPSVHVLGLRIDEPVTMLTDLLVSLVCFVAFARLRNAGSRGNAQMFFRFYFLLLGTATLLGGVMGHGFLYAFSLAWKLPGWIVSMVSVACIERSAIEQAKPLVRRWVGKFFLVLNIIELLTIMTVTISTQNFKWVEFHSGYGLLAIVMPFHLYVYYRTRDKASAIVILAVLIACLAALAFMNKISIDTWFNYLDVSHVFMAIGVYVFMKGALAMKNHSGSPAAIASI